jgi:hypothetical protein
MPYGDYLNFTKIVEKAVLLGRGLYPIIFGQKMGMSAKHNIASQV